MSEDQTISLVSIYLEDAPTCDKNTCYNTFIESIVIISRRWKEPRCLSTEKWIQKMWYIYTIEF